MASTDLRLSTSRYVRPGTYIGRVNTPQPSVLTGFPRFPGFVGRGSRLARESNSRHIRSRVYNESLNFSLAPPYYAPLDQNAYNDKTLTVLAKSTGEEVPYASWQFVETVSGSGNYDRVQIDDKVFDNQASYIIEYQSVDRDVLDELQFDDIRSIQFAGDSEGSSRYIEYEDFRINTTLTGQAGDTDALEPDSGNTYTDGSASIAADPGNAGSGMIALSSGSDYTWPYDRTYTIVVDSIAAGPPKGVVFTISASSTSGGNSQTTNMPFHSSLSTTTIQISEGSGDDSDFEIDKSANYTADFPAWWPNDGLKIDLTYGAGNFSPGDTWTITANGPGMIEFSSAHGNTNQFAEVETPVEATTNTSSGKISVNSESEYDGEFDRDYTLYVSNVAVAAAPNREATILWTGYNEIPNSEGSITVTEATSSTLNQVLVEKDVYLDFTFGPEHALADTTNTITAGSATSLATALLLATNVKSVFNAHDANTGSVWHTAGASSHQITAADPIDLTTLRTACLDIQTQYVAHLADTTMHVVADTLWGLSNTVTSTSTLADMVSFLNEIVTKYPRHRQSTNFIVGDYWTVSAKTDRREYTAKDDRSYEITINAVNSGTSVVTTYNAKTYEGSWGSLTLNAVGGSYPDPYLDLPDNVRLMFRNVDDRFDANDKFTFSATCNDTVDWSLVRRETETIVADDIEVDAAGTVTGVPLAYYIILDETPSSILRIKESASGTHLSYTHVTGTPYIYFSTDPGVDIQVDYEWKGYEPDPASSYFITANRKRADSEFNTGVRYLTADEARLGLWPSSTTNHLWIAAEIAFETSFFGGYFFQVKSHADNEVYNMGDYRNAIDATEENSDITDVVVLSYYKALSYAKNSIEKMNDPFENKQRLLWVGTPAGTAVGDDRTPDTLIYLARKTLQVAPDSPAKGNIILIANNQATRTQAMEDGSVTTLSLDGSFIAAHAAALTASFTDPADSIFKRQVAAFDSVETFTDKQVILLGSASTTHLNSLGSGLYEYGQSLTVDTSEVALQEISGRTQEHYVLRRVVRELSEVIGFVPPSPSSGVLVVQNQLVNTLGAIASSGFIAPFGSNEGTERPINPSTDVKVYADPDDQRIYHFKYYFNIRVPIKHLFGLYSVNTKFWDARSLSA